MPKTSLNDSFIIINHLHTFNRTSSPNLKKYMWYQQGTSTINVNMGHDASSKNHCMFHPNYESTRHDPSMESQSAAEEEKHHHGSLLNIWFRICNGSQDKKLLVAAFVGVHPYHPPRCFVVHVPPVLLWRFFRRYYELTVTVKLSTLSATQKILPTLTKPESVSQHARSLSSEGEKIELPSMPYTAPTMEIERPVPNSICSLCQMKINQASSSMGNIIEGGLEDTQAEEMGTTIVLNKPSLHIFDPLPATEGPTRNLSQVEFQVTSRPTICGMRTEIFAKEGDAVRYEEQVRMVDEATGTVAPALVPYESESSLPIEEQPSSNPIPLLYDALMEPSIREIIPTESYNEPFCLKFEESSPKILPALVNTPSESDSFPLAEEPLISPIHLACETSPEASEVPMVYVEESGAQMFEVPNDTSKFESGPSLFAAAEEDIYVALAEIQDTEAFTAGDPIICEEVDPAVNAAEPLEPEVYAEEPYIENERSMVDEEAAEHEVYAEEPFIESEMPMVYAEAVEVEVYTISEEPQYEDSIWPVYAKYAGPTEVCEEEGCAETAGPTEACEEEGCAETVGPTEVYEEEVCAEAAGPTEVCEEEGCAETADPREVCEEVAYAEPADAREVCEEVVYAEPADPQAIAYQESIGPELCVESVEPAELFCVEESVYAVPGIQSELTYIDSPAPVLSTPAEFQANLDSYVENAGLEMFFPPSNTYLSTVSQKAAWLRNDRTTDLGTPQNVRRLTRLSLYHPVIYCDDSGSMLGSPFETQKQLVSRIARVATRIVPSEFGLDLYFINRGSFHNLAPWQIDSALRSVQPTGWTAIGSNLKSRILQPLVYDTLNWGKRLARPLLICVITDGSPTEYESTFKNVIVECRRRIQAAGYNSTAVRFSISQIGNDSSAARFLDELRNDG
ncbi:hypothetical protein M422DRAFT_51796 [Sphaerobolus stellatus SS14]|uniref:VWFA domain-containing protein n=1 Tax=Sphaerobolus stellatus (strain SS14) TaxID=990650 RepID=A0A0C9VBJ5_SPHS4|nr:hypothetical protein M422DRAFT_51796 [Sphaerobolus stellatus SS14]